MTEFSESQKEFMKELFDKLNTSLNEKTAEIRNEFTQQIENIKKEIHSVVTSCQEKNRELENKNKELQQRVIHLERRTRKNNLVLFGIKQDTELNLLQSVIEIFRSPLEVNVEESDLSHVYRINNKNIVVVEFISYQKKLLVFDNARKLKGTGISISTDQCLEDREQHKLLLKHREIARGKGQTAYIKTGKLYISNKPYTAEELKRQEELVDIEESNISKAGTQSRTHITDEGSPDDLNEQHRGKNSKQTNISKNKIATRATVYSKRR